MKVVNGHRIFHNLARPLVSRFSVKKSLSKPTAKNQNTARLREVPMHTVVFWLGHNLWLLNLILDRLSGLAFDQIKAIGVESAGPMSGNGGGVGCTRSLPST